MACDYDNKITPLTRRGIFSQLLATTSQNLLMLVLGISISISTIIIPALLGSNDSLSFTGQQASWFGSIALIVLPLGSVFSGFITESIGRKKSLMTANVPCLAAYLIFYFAQNVEMLFLGNVLLGIGTGCMEAPAMSYVGEISHPSIRGMLTALTQVFAAIGVFICYILGNAFDWRNVSLISAFIPLITLLATFPIPESPVWLLTRNKPEEALKALCWIRGWTSPETVKSEFEEMIFYQKNNNKCWFCTSESDDSQCTHKVSGLKNKLKTYYGDMTRKVMIRPLLLVMFMFICHHMVGTNPIRANMINIFKCFGFTIDAKRATVIIGIVGITFSTCMIFFVKLFGKRILVLISLIACSICTMSIGIYAYIFIPHETNSYLNTNVLILDYAWIPMTLFILLNVSTFCGMEIIPWIIVSEIFPLRGRGLACAIAAAFAFIVGFSMSKAHYDLEVSLGIYGVFWFYSIGSFIGFVVLYFYMPETEGKRMEEIEEHFSAEKMPIVADDCVIRGVRNFFGFKGRKFGLRGSKRYTYNIETISVTVK